MRNEKFKCSVIVCFLLYLFHLSPIANTKEHSLNYKFYHDYIELVYLDPSWANATLQIRMFNRTTKVLNATFVTRRELYENATVRMSAQQMRNNQYRYMPALDHTFKLKTLLSLTYFSLPSLMVDHATPPITWPVVPHVKYTVSDWIPDAKSFPIMYKSEGRWKVILQVYFDGVTKGAEIWWFLVCKTEIENN